MARAQAPGFLARWDRDPAGPFPAHRWGIGAFFLAFAVLVLSAVILAAILRPPGSPGVASMSTLLAGTIVPAVLAAGVALLATALRGNGPVIDLRLRPCVADLRTGLKLGALGLLVTVVAVEIWTQIVGSENATSALGELVSNGRLTLAAAIVTFLYTWLIGPICEEIIFRGLCWGAIEPRWGRWWAFGLSTVIFAASHLEPLRTSLLLVISIPIALGRLLTGRLTASVIAHQINNFLPALTVLLVALGVMRG